ncbi:hypothetical protein [Candidatus Similichlamydia epinepheli]|uniref:hypothetical protein n=1 Tax=Candidatus Similichlamydia epinepheli TaxID=1903953 RepID=UPI001863FDD0|nr:hypothetical protein [Candidatus Similichlamydia epinepheli]
MNYALLDLVDLPLTPLTFDDPLAPVIERLEEVVFRVLRFVTEGPLAALPLVEGEAADDLVAAAVALLFVVVARRVVARLVEETDDLVAAAVDLLFGVVLCRVVVRPVLVIFSLVLFLAPVTVDDFRLGRSVSDASLVVMALLPLGNVVEGLPLERLSPGISRSVLALLPLLNTVDVFPLGRSSSDALHAALGLPLLKKDVGSFPLLKRSFSDDSLTPLVLLPAAKALEGLPLGRSTSYVSLGVADRLPLVGVVKDALLERYTLEVSRVELVLLPLENAAVVFFLIGRLSSKSSHFFDIAFLTPIPRVVRRGARSKSASLLVDVRGTLFCLTSLVIRRPVEVDLHPSRLAVASDIFAFGGRPRLTVGGFNPSELLIGFSLVTRDEPLEAAPHSFLATFVLVRVENVFSFSNSESFFVDDLRLIFVVFTCEIFDRPTVALGLPRVTRADLVLESSLVRFPLSSTSSSFSVISGSGSVMCSGSGDFPSERSKTVREEDESSTCFSTFWEPFLAGFFCFSNW